MVLNQSVIRLKRLRNVEKARAIQAPLTAKLEIFVYIGVGGFYEIFDEADYFFQFLSSDQMRDRGTIVYGL